MRIPAGTALRPRTTARAWRWVTLAAVVVLFPVVGAAPTRADGILDHVDPAGGGDPVSHESKQHRLVERSFHPLLNDSGNVGPPAIQVTDDDRLFAYIGSFFNGVECPQAFDTDPHNHADTQDVAGVKVVELTDPDNPTLVTVISTTPNDTPKDVRTITVTTDGARRDLLVVSRQVCLVTNAAAQGAGPTATKLPWPGTGFEVHDVTDPGNPQKLGEWASGGIGVHNLTVFVRPDLADPAGRVEEGRVFVAAAVQDGGGDPGNVVRHHGLGEPAPFIDGFLNVVEITDPANPTLVSGWKYDDAGAVCLPRGRPAAESCELHDVQLSDDGRRAYLAYWDAGVVILDISDVEGHPRLVGQWFPPPDRCPQRPCAPTDHDTLHHGVPIDDDGSTHTVVPVSKDGRDLVLVTDEEVTTDTDTGTLNGFLRVVDVTDDPEDPLNPVEWRQIATYVTPHGDRDGRWFHAHQAWPGPTMPGGGDIYLAARADGVRVLRLEEQGTEVQDVAWFVAGPDDHPDDLDHDPHGLRADDFGFEAAWPVVHPRAPHPLLVLAVDFHRGLYILEPTTP